MLLFWLAGVNGVRDSPRAA